MMKFSLGKVVSSHGVSFDANECKTGDFRRAMDKMLRRHMRGDWGLCCEEDKKTNDDAINTGFRIVSMYEHDDTKYFVITEADRSLTTILECSEY